MKRFPHYFICYDCAGAKGGVWPEGHVATVCEGRCKYCKSKVKKTLIPWVDFNWPKSASIDRKAKISRD